jgi:hypothetical protein
MSATEAQMNSLPDPASRSFPVLEDLFAEINSSDMPMRWRKGLSLGILLSRKYTET